MSVPSLHRESTNSLITYSFPFSNVLVDVKPLAIQVSACHIVGNTAIFNNTYREESMILKTKGGGGVVTLTIPSMAHHLKLASLKIIVMQGYTI